MTSAAAGATSASLPYAPGLRPLVASPLPKATAKWRQMGVRSVHEALGIYTHGVRAPPLG